jgi:thiamine-monophosphate kinase
MKKEIEYINSLIKNYPRSNQQMNYPFHSDAEVLKIEDGYLGVSVDAVSEEINLKLIQNPETLGWMTVTASVSDLAAIGFKTNKISLLLKTSTESNEWISAFDKGAAEAAHTYGISEIEKVYAKGSETLTACTAYGISKNPPPLSRVGLNAGDQLFLTGPIGWGNATALANIAIRKDFPSIADLIDKTYRPKARSEEAQFISQFSKVCIDTSDGLLATLKWLEIFNHKKLVVDYSKNLFHKIALDVAEKTKVDPWLFLASQNGEFELLFAVSNEKANEFKEKSVAAGFQFLQIGKVAEGEGLALILNGIEKKIIVDQLLDMLQEGVDPETYIKNMLTFAHVQGIKF